MARATLRTKIARQTHKDLVTTKPKPHVCEKSTAKGVPKTYVTEYEVEYVRAVLAFEFEWDGFFPSAANNWGLEENACWPKDITHTGKTTETHSKRPHRKD